MKTITMSAALLALYWFAITSGNITIFFMVRAFEGYCVGLTIVKFSKWIADEQNK